MQGYYTNVKEQVLGVTPKNDLLFIDGDYSYEGCKADWDLCTDMLCFMTMAGQKVSSG